jgi:hypothetical protein
MPFSISWNWQDKNYNGTLTELHIQDILQIDLDVLNAPLDIGGKLD